MCVCVPVHRSTTLLNDFEAVGYGVTILPEVDLVPLNKAVPRPKVRVLQY